MFVDPTRGRSKYVQYALGAAAGVLALGACNDPAQNTGLRPEGPPDVLAVLVMTDAATQLGETATYCKTGDEKRPTQVGLPDFTLSQICDADSAVAAPMVSAAYPDGWYVRIMFDELLDPNIEELIEILDPDTGEGTDTFTGTIANTQPVILECESVAGGFVEVPYDGYYSPAGNAVTWPLGPSLVIKPDEPRAIATNKMCRITLRDNIEDKSGEKIPADQRGPFPFKIAPITPIAITPEDDPDFENPVDPLTFYDLGDDVYVQFNTSVDQDSWCDEGVPVPPATTGTDCEFEFTETEGFCSTGGEACVIGGPACPTAADTCDKAGGGVATSPLLGLTDAEYLFWRNAPLQAGKKYKFNFIEGTKIKDRCGVETTFGAPDPAELTEINIINDDFKFKSLVPANGDVVSSLRKPNLTFNNFVDFASLTSSEYSVTPAPMSPGVTSSGADLQSEANFLFTGHYAPGTMYTFTLNAGATINDAFGVVYTNATEKKITWTTQPLAITSITPVDKSTFTIGGATLTPRVSIGFNQSMVAASLLPAEYTFVNGAGTVVPTAVTASGCALTSTSCSLRVSPTPAGTILVPGTYKFTLKANATITDVLGNTFTQPTDRSVSFTVANGPAAVICL